jgi:hypothetical protein
MRGFKSRAGRTLSAWEGCEGLEPRQLLAAVSWDGGAGDNLWHSPGNWSTDTVPTAADDVTIDVAGSPTIVLNSTTGSQAVNSLLTREAIQISTGTNLTVTTTALIEGGASVQMLGGTLTGGSWSIVSGSFQTTSSGGTLNNVALGFDLLLSAASSAITIRGTTSFTAARLQNGLTTLRIASGYTLNAPVIAEGAPTGARFVLFAFNTPGTFTIGPSGSLRLAPNCKGNFSVQDQASGVLLNNGSIINEAPLYELSILASTFTNAGNVTSTAGITTIDGSLATNQGTIIVRQNTTLNIRSGTFDATVGIGAWTNTGGSVNFRGGNINNTGSTIALNASTGSWNLLSCKLSGGSVTSADGATLRFTGLANLEDVTLGFDVVLTESYPLLTLSGTTSMPAVRMLSTTTLRLAAGYTLSAPVIVEGPDSRTRLIEIGFGGPGTVTIAPTASIRVAAGTKGNLNIFNPSSTIGTLINNGSIINEATGFTLDIAPNTLTNNGLIQTGAGTLSIRSATFTNSATGSLVATNATFNILPTSWSSAGSISVTSSTLNLGGSFNINGINLPAITRTGGTVNLTGVMNNVGSTLALNAATGSWTMQGGTISGGSVTAADGATLLFGSGGLLDNVAVGSELVLSALDSSITVKGTTTFPAARIQNAANFRMAAGYVLSVPVIGEGATSGQRSVQIAADGAGTVTVAAGGSIRLAPGTGGNMAIVQTFGTNSSVGNLINDASIINEAAGRTLSVELNEFTNNGTLTAAAGTTTVASATFTNPGTFAVGSGATVNLQSGRFDATSGIGSWTNAGGTVNIALGTIDNTGNTLTLNSSTGSWTLARGTISGGTLAFANGNTLLFTSTGGNLSGISVSGGLELSEASTTVTLVNSTVAGAIRLTGVGASLVLQGTNSFGGAYLSNDSTGVSLAANSTLSSPIIADGPAAGARLISPLNANPGTPTIAPGGSIRLAPGAGADLNVSASLINNGSIISEAAGRTLNITSTAITNNGLLQSTAGTLTINPTTFTGTAVGALNASNSIVNLRAATWSHLGSTNIDTATLNLGGTFSTSGFNFAGFTRTAGTINITGTINNGSSTLTFNSRTGSWILLGGTISNGTIAFEEGNTLVYSSTGGTLSGVSFPSGVDFTGPGHKATLNNVSIAGELRLTGSSSSATLTGNTTFAAIRLRGGSSNLQLNSPFTLSAPIIAEGAATSARSISFSGIQTIASGGSIRLAADSAVDLTINASGSTLVNNGLIINEAPGRTLAITGGTFNNAGTISASAGITTVEFYTNSGTIAIGPTATLNLRGQFDATAGIGTWANAGGTVNITTSNILNTGRTITLNNSTGSWTLAGGTITNGTLAFADGKRLLFSAGGGTLSGVTVPSGIDVSTAFGVVTINNSTLGGDLILSGASSVATIQGTTTFPAARLSNGSTWLKFAAGYTLRAPVFAEGAATGTRTVVASSGSTGTLTIAPGASIRLASGTGGTLNISATSNATLINNGSIINEAPGQVLVIALTTFTNNGLLSTVGGRISLSPTNFTNFSGGTLTGGTYSASAGGSFFGSFSGVITTLAATVIQDAVSTIWPSISNLSTIAPTGLLTLDGGTDLALTPAGGTFLNQGTLVLGAGSTLNVTGNVTLAATSLLRVFISGTNAVTDIGRIVATGTVTADGTLNAQLAGGYQPVQGAMQEIIAAGATAGAFATVSLFTPANPGLKAVLVDAGNGFQIETRLTIDFDNSGSVDFGDFLAFFNFFDSGNSAADIDGSGEVDFSDFLLFFNLFDHG